MPVRAHATLRVTLATIAALVVLAPLGMPALAADVSIRIDDALDPARLSIRPGTTVTWINESGDRHRMRSQTGPTEFDSGNMEPGDRFTVTFRREGRWTYLDERDDDDASYWGTIVVAEDADPARTPGPGETSAPSTPDVITMGDRAFRPRSVTVDAGTTVRWRNNDDREHTVTATDRSFDSGVMGTGETFSTKLSSPGTYSYLCAIHPEMTGTITVRGGSGSDPAPTPKPTPKPTPAPTAAPGSETVRVVDLDFRPGTLDVAAGATVVWVNQGAAMHTVTATDGSWDSGMVPSGDSFQRRFREPGTYAYLCSLHPSMTGTVRVSGSGGSVPPPAPQTPAPTDPPPAEPGDLELRDFAFAPTAIQVDAGSTVTWVNAGAAPHTVTAVDGSFDSGILASGAQWSHTFDTPGTWELLCAVHPEMRATLTVAAAGAAGPPASGAAPSTSASPTTSVSPSPSPGLAAGGPAAGTSGGGSGAGLVDGEPVPASSIEAASEPLSAASLVRLGLVVLLCTGAVVAFARLLGSTVRPA